MLALQKYDYGKGKMRLAEVEKPVAGADEVLIEVKACGICGTDIHIYLDDGYPFNPPVIPGHEVSGVVSEIGEGVTEWQVGDPVTAETYYYYCGQCIYCKTGRVNLCPHRYSFGSGVNGAMAEYLKVPARNLHRIPEGISFQEAALTEPLTCCIHAVFEKANLHPGDVVLLSGPGPIGLLCLQAIKLFGCRVLVTGTEQDKERLVLAETFGADEILTVKTPGIKEKIMEYGGGPVIAFECSGSVEASRFCLEALNKGGRYIQVGLPSTLSPVDLNLVALKEQTIAGVFATKPEWWIRSLDLMARKQIDLKPLIGNTYSLYQWETAFRSHMEGKGLKHVFDLTLNEKEDFHEQGLGTS
jgi:L-iditol 2-dehydrogenase